VVSEEVAFAAVAEVAVTTVVVIVVVRLEEMM
jgi:hypothetical protein